VQGINTFEIFCPGALNCLHAQDFQMFLKQMIIFFISSGIIPGSLLKNYQQLTHEKLGCDEPEQIWCG